MEKLLSVEEVADLLAVPKRTLYMWRLKGAGPRAIPVGRYLRYRPSEVEDWLTSQAATGRAT